MNITTLLAEELKRESVSTRKLLECVPEAKGDWKPHEKSFPLSRLAGHVAEIPGWVYHIIKKHEFDLGKDNFERFVFENKEQLLSVFDKKLQEALDILAQTTDEELQQEWTFMMNGNLISKDIRYNELRKWALNHQVHHRAQLGVYLRLLDIPIPGMYGPSADDRAKMQAGK